MIIGIDHGYYAIKTRHCSFPAGLTCYGSHEPYTRQSVLEVDGQFYVCGTGRQPVRCDKTENDTYYLLTLAALAQEIKMRGAPNESSVKIAAGLPLTSFGRDKPKFRQYLLRSQPVLFRFEGTEYKIAVEDVALFPQGYAALLTDPDLLLDEPSLLLMDIGGWTVDLMRIDNARPVAETAHSLEFGMIRCIDAVREQVRRETGLSLTDAQIEQMLAGGPCALGDSVREIVRQQGRAYTERLFALVTEAGFDLRALPTVMLGGGAGIVQRHVGPKDGLHSVFYHGTVEFRLFNATLHAGEVKANIVLAMAISAQAINQQKTLAHKTPIGDNPAFTFRTFLLRLGLIGPEYKNVREHLLKNLPGDRAWRYDKAQYPCNQRHRDDGAR